MVQLFYSFYLFEQQYLCDTHLTVICISNLVKIGRSCLFLLFFCIFYVCVWWLFIFYCMPMDNNSQDFESVSPMYIDCLCLPSFLVF